MSGLNSEDQLKECEQARL